MAQAYDLIVIGAGTGGYVAAIRAAQLGLKTAVVERQKALGGTCLLWGCIPTKALLEHAHALKIVQHAADWGIGLGGATPALDVTAVHARKDKIVSGLTKGIESLFKKHGISWIKGTARLAGQGKVVVSGEDQELTAKHIIVATGSSPRSVPGITIDHKRVITSDEAIHLKEVPGSIAILGSGAVGVEFASIFNRFGSKVTLIELLPRLVPIEDEAVSAELARSFKKQGIAALVGTRVAKAEVKGDAVTLDAQGADGKSQSITADYLLVATGRGPVTDGLGAEGLGLELQHGFVKVDEYLPHQRRRDLGHRRRHYLRRGHAASAAGARVIGRGHPGGRAARRPGRPADQLRPCAGLHVLRPRDRQCRPHRKGRARQRR